MINAIIQPFNNYGRNIRDAWNLSSTCQKFAFTLTTVGLAATIGTTGAALIAKFNPVGYLSAWPNSFYNCVWSNNITDYICTPTSPYYLVLGALGLALAASSTTLIAPLSAYSMIWRPAKAANPALLPAGVFQAPLPLLPLAPPIPINDGR